MDKGLLPYESSSDESMPGPKAQVYELLQLLTEGEWKPLIPGHPEIIKIALQIADNKLRDPEDQIGEHRFAPMITLEVHQSVKEPNKISDRTYIARQVREDIILQIIAAMDDENRREMAMEIVPQGMEKFPATLERDGHWGEIEPMRDQLRSMYYGLTGEELL